LLVSACGASQTDAPPAAKDEEALASSALFAHDFDDNSTGDYRAEWSSDWHTPPWNNGVNDGRASIVDGPEAYAGKSLQILYPAGTYGPGPGGAQWRLELGDSYDELYLAYKIRFGDEFNFVKGGKLPGLVGGAANTGGKVPTGRDGWSARMMWRPMGAIVFYVYHMDQHGTWGEDMVWRLDGRQVYFEPGVWYQLEHRVVINTPGEPDGVLQGWLDGELAFERTDLRFRDVDSFAIDALYFSTFFGGNDKTWATRKDETITFDDFVISTGPIAH
jgi:hypothetical protein